jgi:hypothetical protein
MIRMSLKLAVGILLTGCTINTYRTTHYDPKFRTETTVTQNVLLGSIATEEKSEVKQPMPNPASEPTVVRPLVVTGNSHLRPSCKPYEPPAVPDPIKIDFADLEKASSAQEINEVALANVKALHQQIMAIQVQQKKSYDEYVKRCVIR